MRKRLTYILLLMMCLTGAASAHTYVNQSVLHSGTWVKMSVTQSGMHYLTYDEIQKAGLNPANLRIYGYGGAQLDQDFMRPKIDDLPEVPYYTYTGADGVFNKGDYIVFYAQGLARWRYDGQTFRHTGHTYATKGYYFLTDGAGAPTPIAASETLTEQATYQANTYTALWLHEVDSLNLVDREGKEGGGQEFFEEFPSSRTMQLQISMPDLISTSPIVLNTEVAAYSSTASTFRYTLNQQQKTLTTKAIATNNFYTKAAATSGSFSLNPANADVQTLEITFQNSTNGSHGYLNYVEACATCSLVLRDQPLAFRNTEHYGSSELTLFTLSRADSEVQLWRITDLSQIERVSTTLQGNQLTFKGNNQILEEYIAFRPSDKQGMRHPTIEGPIDNQNLHALTNIDLVIIAPKELVGAAERLAAAHETHDGLITAVVTDQQVYNEFSSGTPDATAYRWLMKMLYDRARTNAAYQAPQYLILMGDGTFDNRKLLAASGKNTLLTYQAKNSLDETYAYASDDYFGFLDDSEGEEDTAGRMDIAVGRFPVNTLDEANAVVDKCIDYMEATKAGAWKSQLCFLADDGDRNQHTEISDAAAESVRTNNPDFVVNKIYIDAYTQETNAAGESYPLAEKKFKNMLASGVLFFDYSGHGGYNGITSESMITLKDIREMTNQNRGLWFLATCNFSSWDAGLLSAGEEAVLNPDGGAIATISSCRTVYAPQNGALNNLFCDTLFAHTGGHYTMTIGKALQCAKNKRGADMNKMPYTLLGDPAIRLAYPDDYRVMTTTQLDTLRALSVQTVEGYIRTDEADTATWFNGKLQVTILDKMQQITTLDNDQSDAAQKRTYTYNDYPSPLFKGETVVENGRFSYTFMVPKDIRYNYGNGRIVYYAIDSLTAEEAIGHYDDFLVGGSGTVLIEDTIGPDLHIYLNTPSFEDGGISYETPRFYADIEDEHGINTAGSGIGHDLLLTVDNDPNKTFIVNDYFTAQNGSYQRGRVSYALSEMDEGQHSLTFRAWDLLNNSSSASLNFQIVKGYEPNICSVMTYPNPVSAVGNLNILIDFDQPDVSTTTRIYIYDLSGRLVYQMEQKGADAVRWNLRSAPVHAGVYVYKVELQTSSAAIATKSGKIIVTQ